MDGFLVVVRHIPVVLGAVVALVQEDEAVSATLLFEHNRQDKCRKQTF